MSSGRQKSVVLVTVDCLRADHCGFMGYTRPTTPFLDQFARESFVFPGAIVTGAPTYYSFPGILASRSALSLGREVVGIAPGEVTLATTLRENGYRTGAFVAGNPYLSARFGYDQGFDIFRDFLSEQINPARAAQDSSRGEHRANGGLLSHVNSQLARVMHNLGRLGRAYDEAYFQYLQRIAAAKGEHWDNLRCFPAADILVDEAVNWFSMAGGAPFFLWLHFMDPHAPYYPSPEALTAMGNASLSPAHARYVNESWKRADLSAERRRNYREEIVRLYDAGIRFVDMQVQRLVENLRRQSSWEDCVFIVTADHGEEFLDHDGVFHSPSRPYQEMLRVPLMIRVPGNESMLSAAPFSLVHLAPTVLDALGFDLPVEFEGRSYWPEMQRGDGWHVAISESVGACTNPMQAEKRMAGRVLVVQDERYKLVLDFGRRSEELYDLEADPHERTILPHGAEKNVRACMLRAAHEHLARSRSNSTSALRAIVREIGLEWSQPKQPPKTLAS